MLLLSVNGFDRALFDEALQRFQIEPQSSTNLDAGKLPQPGFLIDRVHFEAEVLGRLPDIQEPPTDPSISRLLKKPSRLKSALRGDTYVVDSPCSVGAHACGSRM